MTLTYNRGEPQSRNGETAVFASGPKYAKQAKNPFFAKKKLKNGKRLMFIWENGTFFSQLFTQMAGTWSGVESECFRNPDFGPNFFNEPVFFSKNYRRAWTWAPHRRWTRPKILFCFRFRSFFIIFAKKSYPPPLCGSVCQ